MQVVIGLGSNIGDRTQNLKTAVQAIDKHPNIKVLRASKLYESEPIGGPAQSDYLNATILVETSLQPVALLEFLQAQERAAGRVRDVVWGPRTLDLDIVDIEGYSSSNPDLTIPHPRVSDREFVLRPLVDIDAAWIIQGESSQMKLHKISIDAARPRVSAYSEDSDWWL